MRQRLPAAELQPLVTHFADNDAGALARAMLTMPVTLAVRLGQWLERTATAHSYTCPYCFRRRSEIYLACSRPGCGVIHGSLWPAWGELIGRSCPRCSNAVALLGQYLRGRQPRMVCRPGAEFDDGCMRMFPSEIPFRRCREKHVSFVGPTRWTRLAAMHLVWECLSSPSSRWRASSCWEQTQLEQQYLRAAFTKDARKLAESEPDNDWWLARTAVFRVPGVRPTLLTFHNVPERAFASDDRLRVMAPHLGRDEVIVLVADLKHPGREQTGLLPHAEMVSRMVRALERDFLDPWSNRFLNHVVVLVPATDGRDWPPAEAEEHVRLSDPHLWGLLKNVATPPVVYLGGRIERSEPLPAWCQSLVRFLVNGRPP